jgi:hypothetical protein
MLRFRISYHVKGEQDSFILEGETVEEIRSQAEQELERRGGENPWSEEL